MKMINSKLSLEEGLTKEWVITNGIGGFASSTIFIMAGRSDRSAVLYFNIWCLRLFFDFFIADINDSIIPVLRIFKADSLAFFTYGNYN